MIDLQIIPDRNIGDFLLGWDGHYSKRDYDRTKKSREVWYNIPMAIICDIDDTLLRNGTQPIERTITYINDQHSRTAVILVTGRPESQRTATVRALKTAGVKYNRLIMNPGSTANSNAYKYDTAMKLNQSVDITMAIDNDEGARRAYRRAGIKNVINPSSLPDLKKFWNHFFV